MSVEKQLNDETYFQALDKQFLNFFHSKFIYYYNFSVNLTLIFCATKLALIFGNLAQTTLEKNGFSRSTSYLISVPSTYIAMKVIDSAVVDEEGPLAGIFSKALEALNAESIFTDHENTKAAELNFVGLAIESI